MEWIKKGRIFINSGMIPTPDELGRKIYYSSCDSYGRARVHSLDYSIVDNKINLSNISESLFDLGKVGTFDDNGCVVTSIVTLDNGDKYLYYVGFELCEKVRYRLFIGLAVSTDAGKTFKRFSNVPILDRTDKECYFRCGPYVTIENGIFRMWYVAGDKWLDIDNKSMPVYLIKYLESKDGINWGDCGKVCIDIENDNEHGFGRPYVIKKDGLYRMFYSKRVKHLGYRMGYAESKDGIDWIRKDEKINIDISNDMWESKMVCYPSIIHNNNNMFMLYNGNGFGETGFGYAELKKW